MLYFFRSERYEFIIERHNDVEKHGYESESYSEYDSEEDETTDSSMEGRNRWSGNRRAAAEHRLPKKYRRKQRR